MTLLKWLAFDIIVERHNAAEFLNSHNTAVDPRPFHRVGVGGQDGEGGFDQGLLVGEEDTPLGKLDQQDLRIRHKKIHDVKWCWFPSVLGNGFGAEVRRVHWTRVLTAYLQVKTCPLVGSIMTLGKDPNSVI